MAQTARKLSAIPVAQRPQLEVVAASTRERKRYNRIMTRKERNIVSSYNLCFQRSYYLQQQLFRVHFYTIFHYRRRLPAQLRAFQKWKVHLMN